MRRASFFFFSFPLHFSLLVPRKGEDGSNVIVTVLRSAFRNLSFLRFGVINHLLELIISIHPSMDVLDGREIPSSIPSSTREEKKKNSQIFQRTRRSEEFLIYESSPLTR